MIWRIDMETQWQRCSNTNKVLQYNNTVSSVWDDLNLTSIHLCILFLIYFPQWSLICTTISFHIFFLIFSVSALSFLSHFSPQLPTYLALHSLHTFQLFLLASLLTIKHSFTYCVLILFHSLTQTFIFSLNSLLSISTLFPPYHTILRYFCIRAKRVGLLVKETIHNIWWICA